MVFRKAPTVWFHKRNRDSNYLHQQFSPSV